MRMKTLILLLAIAGMMIAAGCSVPVATPDTHGTTGNVLPMHANTTLGSGNKTLDVYIDSIELDPKAENESGRTLTIYVAARNTGMEPVKLVWYSKLTDLNGNTYGGINVSHGGNGARSGTILPGTGEAVRDFIDQLTNQNLGVLSKGAVLDVYFFEKSLSNGTISQKPDYHVAWTIDPGAVLG